MDVLCLMEFIWRRVAECGFGEAKKAALLSYDTRLADGTTSRLYHDDRGCL